MNITWKIKQLDNDIINKLIDFGYSRVIASLLFTRGINDIEAARNFLNPHLTSLYDPFLLPDMQKAVLRIVKAIENNENILIHGDYDADGITSTALLVRLLKALKSQVGFKLPHRLSEGYDIKPESIDWAKENGFSLIITCDCGISALSTAARAKELKIDLIITDHHEPGDELPDALAVINPKRTDSKYPFRELAGVGVAFKLGHAIVKQLEFNEESYIKKFVELASIGTVTDIVPLTDENRIIVKYGLEYLPLTNKAGLQAIFKTAKISSPISTFHLGYYLGPRINAAGRMSDAAIAVELLLTNSAQEAAEIAAELEKHNTNRKSVQEIILQDATFQIEELCLHDNPVIIAISEDWHSGIIGITAGRIREIYGKPTVMLTLDREAGMATGSARSIAGFSVIECLRASNNHILNCGGHEMAAGLTLEIDKLTAFKESIYEYSSSLIKDEMLLPSIDIDLQIDINEIDINLAREIKAMEPFGEANSEPIFMINNAIVNNAFTVGSDAKHLKLILMSASNKKISCIGFDKGHLLDQIESGAAVDICGFIQENSYNGKSDVQINIVDIRLHESLQ